MMDMIQRIIGLTIGVIVSLILLVATTSVTLDQAIVPLVVGAVAAFFWPIVIAWFLVRRAKARRDRPNPGRGPTPDERAEARLTLPAADRGRDTRIPRGRRIVAGRAVPDRVTDTHAKSYFRPDIEGLRAIAIGAVLLFHAGVPAADRRLHRRRRLLRHLRLPHHRPARPGVERHRAHRPGRVLRAALPATAASGPLGDRGHGRRLVLHPLRAALSQRRPRRCRGRGLRIQYPLRHQCHRLPRRGDRAVTAAALLVAGRRGAVLPLLAADRSSSACDC